MSQESLQSQPLMPMTPVTADDLLKAGHLEEAARAYENELSQDPENPRLMSNYSGLLSTLGDFDRAYTLALRATTLDPEMPGAWCNLGNAFSRLQKYDEAIAAYRRCLELKPDHAIAIDNLGCALDYQGQHDLAQKFHQAAIELTPNDPLMHSNYALSLLIQGKYREGFKEYEWRWNTLSTRRKHTNAPVWQGESFVGRTLLLQTEGGFGDMLQFIRFLPFVCARGGRVVTRIRPQLLRLFQYSFPDQVFITEDDPIPEHDLQCFALSLPYALGTTLQTIPFPAGYLRVDPKNAARWEAILRKDLPLKVQKNSKKRPLRIGLVWAGAPHPEVRVAAFADQRRSTDLQTFAPLAEALPKTLFYSLQIGERAEQANTPPRGMRLINHTALLEDFADTAALISLLDLVISVDTSTAHVAAALGKPTWILSRYDHCWRWLAGRSDSPWYDSVHIYQQKTPLDWTDTLNQIVTDLKQFSHNVG